MACQVWEPKAFLCGCGHRTASLFIGWMGTVFSTLHVAHVLVYTQMFYADFDRYCKEQRAVDTEACATGLISGIVITGVVSVLTAIGSVMLIFGVKRKEPVFVLVYIVIKVFSLVLYGTFTVCLMLYLFFTAYAYWNYLIGVVGFFGIFLEVYSFLCVRVYYRQLKYPISYQRTEDYRRDPLKVTILKPVDKIQVEV
ncbi:uncharacterized protein LOC135212670 [Macrobrachium nipponense]|uniref:uncharacterized protein LOC135212670 n=1 Tax=Macrobrachium nipponense TaxID=159736 RepID=UPI0030C806F5